MSHEHRDLDSPGEDRYGYHATYHPQLVFLAHFAQMSTAQRADLEVSA